MDELAICFRASKSLIAEVDEACKALGLSRSELIRRAIESYLSSKSSIAEDHMRRIQRQLEERIQEAQEAISRIERWLSQGEERI